MNTYNSESFKKLIRAYRNAGYIFCDETKKLYYPGFNYKFCAITEWENWEYSNKLIREHREKKKLDTSLSSSNL